MVGLLLPLTPLGGLLGMSALPPLYYLLLATVLALYAYGLRAARTRYERKWSYHDPVTRRTPEAHAEAGDRSR